MEAYEVIVVGAGPGGLKCAETLAKAGKKVLLLEKNNVIGPKVCAGGLSERDVKYLNLPSRLLDRKFNEVKTHTKHGISHFKLSGYYYYTVDRKNLGQWQLRQLKKTNAVVKTGSEVTAINKDYIVVNNSKKIKFKFLVGADGASSIVRKHLGLKNEKTGVAVQYMLKTKKYKHLEMFFDSKLFYAWYAWIFPHKNYVTIGCGCYQKWFQAKKVLEHFNIWLKENGINISKGVYQAYIINSDFRGYRFGNVFLVGDAAGLTPCFTGKGIYPALISGEEVAKLILNKNYVPNKINGIIRIWARQARFVTFLNLIGPLRTLVYDSMMLLFKSQFIEKEILNVLLE